MNMIGDSYVSLVPRLCGRSLVTRLQLHMNSWKRVYIVN